MQTETAFKLRLAPKLRKIPRAYFIKTQMLAVAGVPDFLGVVRGRFVALELKASEKEKPRRLQEYVLRKIREAGGVALVIFPENEESVLAHLSQIA